MKFQKLVSQFAAFLALAAHVHAAALTRETNETFTLPLMPSISGYGVSNLFGDLVFSQPVGIACPPGETNRLFILERQGRIIVVTNLAAPTRTLFLDLRTSVRSAYLETGLLGMAFHPGYSTNRQFYVYRTLFTSTAGAGNALHNQLSRFETSASNPNQALSESETVIFAQYDSSEEHNAGDVHFGPDGYLYVSLGEEIFPPGYYVANRQPIDRKLHGAIIRIDVDKRPGSLPPNPHPGISTNYTIPPDNPFIGVTNYHGFSVDLGKVRTEFYAVGFRNPWRFSFDPLTGDLYCGDVGGAHYEEVSIIKSGGNYGWPFREAAHDHVHQPPAAFTSIDPFIEYSHGNKTNEGNSVTGGLVYRGSAIPQLYGWYVFGDYVRGHLWAAHYDGTPGLKPFLRLTGDLSIAAFGYDPRDGEIIFANMHEGRIKKLVYVPPETASPFPQTLAETGAFADLNSLAPFPGIVPYDVSVNFWSDHAHKQRWFSIPDAGSQIGFQEDGNWEFPPGMIWIKHFELEITNGLTASRRRLETRFLVKGTDSSYGVTYIWDDAQTNAVLAPQEGLDQPITIYNPDGTVLRNQVWHYPSQSECRTCHNHSAGHALGFNTPQLNREHDYDGITTNQLLALSDAGYLNTILDSPKHLRTLYQANDTSTPLMDRARSYFQANCYSCHHPGSFLVNSSYWDARAHIPLDDARIVNNYYVTPRDPEESWIFKRISERGRVWQMPPISSAELDHASIDLVRDWILAFPAPPWSYGDMGEAEREGSSSILPDEIQIAGAGKAQDTASEALHFLSQPLTGNGHLLARLISQQQGGTEARAGLMLREGSESDARNAMVSVLASGENQFEGRVSTGAEQIRINGPSYQLPLWIRLLREGNTFTGSISTDGTNWVQAGELTAGFAETLRAGFATTSDDDYELNLARFTDFSMVELSLAASNLPDQDIAPALFNLEAQVRHTGAEISRVEFLNDAHILGTAQAPPYSMVWADIPVGSHTVMARALDTNGMAVTSEPLNIEVRFPPAQAVFAISESGTGGNWKERFGSEGFALAADGTNLQWQVDLGMEGASEFVWDTSGSDSRALTRGNGTGSIAACWYSDDPLLFDLPLKDGALKNLTIYCVDWDSHGNRTQLVELLDGRTGLVLNSTVLTDFTDGVYLTWKVRGHVKVRITPLSGNAVVSAMFFDPVENSLPLVNLASPLAGQILTAPATVAIQVEASDLDGEVRRVEYFANGTKLGESTAPPYQFEWSPLLAGAYTLTARAWDDLNASRIASPVNVTLALPDAWVKFIHEDETIQGSWRGVLGRTGHLIANHSSSLPAFVTVQSDARTFTWANRLSDLRALQHAAGPYRIASCYVDTVSLDLKAGLSDGRPYQLSLYFLDWDSTVRQSRIEVTELSTGQLLDAREVRDYHQGKLLTWIVRGGVRFTIKRLQGNAVFSGLFIDPAPPVDHWRSMLFSTSQLRNPLVSGNYMDPDGDGRQNLLEHAVGSNPLLPEVDRILWATPEHSGANDLTSVQVSYKRSRKATDVTFSLKGTSDWTQWQDVSDLFDTVEVVDNEDGETETVRLKQRDLFPGHLFLRLEVNEETY